MFLELKGHFVAIHLRSWLKWLLIAPCIAILTLVFLFLRDNPDPNFWLVRSIPVPPSANHIVKSYNSLFESPIGGYRIITFETYEPADVIQQFYRTELSIHGWYLLCSPTEPEPSGVCPSGLSSEAQITDVYKRNDEASKMREIDVIIYKEGKQVISSDYVKVEIIEYRYPLSSP